MKLFSMEALHSGILEITHSVWSNMANLSVNRLRLFEVRLQFLFYYIANNRTYKNYISTENRDDNVSMFEKIFCQTETLIL